MMAALFKHRVGMGLLDKTRPTQSRLGLAAITGATTIN